MRKKRVVALAGVLALALALLTNFRLVINPQAGRLKGKRTPYAVLPKKCPKSGKFVIRTKYYFQDYERRSGRACPRPRAPSTSAGSSRALRLS